MQHQKGTLFRFDERVPMRYQVMGPERHLLLQPERLPFPALSRWLLRVSEPGPHKGQALPLPSRGWMRRGNSKRKMQSAKWRNRGKVNDLGTNEARRTMYERTSRVTFGDRSFSNTGERSCVVRSSRHESIRDRALTRELSEGQVMAGEV